MVVKDLKDGFFSPWGWWVHRWRLTLHRQGSLKDREEQGPLLTPTGCVVRTTDDVTQRALGECLFLLYNAASLRALGTFGRSPCTIKNG